MTGPLREGGGGKEKRTFFGTFFSKGPKFQRPLSSRRGGDKAQALKNLS